MKKLIIAGPLLVTLSGISAPAAAQPVPNWTGFYIGANGGYGWSKDSTTAAPFQNFPPAFGNTLIPFFTLSNPVNGAVFGGQLGYNYQIAPTWVIGVEGDFDGTGLNGASQSIVPEPFGVRTRGVSNGFSAREKVEWLASVRARLGYAWGPSLFYVTGGGAWERVSDNFLLSTSFVAGEFGSSSAGSATATLSGYAVGGGSNGRSARTGPCAPNICITDSVAAATPVFSLCAPASPSMWFAGRT
jgi:outer membrane immunogenic protein